MTTTLPQALIAEIEHALATNGWTMVPEGTLVDDSMHGYWVNPQHVDRDHILAALCSVFSANPYYTCAWPGRSHAGWRTGTGNAYHPGLYLFAARRRPHAMTRPEINFATIDAMLAEHSLRRVPDGTPVSSVSDRAVAWWISGEYDIATLRAALPILWRARDERTTLRSGWNSHRVLAAPDQECYFLIAEPSGTAPADTVEILLRAFTSAVDIEVRCNSSQEEAEAIWAAYKKVDTR